MDAAVKTPLLANDPADASNGLTTAEAARRLEAYGRNEVPVETPSALRVSRAAERDGRRLERSPSINVKRPVQFLAADSLGENS